MATAGNERNPAPRVLGMDGRAIYAEVVRGAAVYDVNRGETDVLLGGVLENQLNGIPA